jgi:hypothetical protein
MRTKNPERGDEENSSFELSESALESIKPGAIYGDEASGEAKAGQVHGTEGHHRLARSDRKDVPQESLAARVRKASKGG